MLLVIHAALAARVWSSSLEDVDPPLRARLVTVFSALRAEGFTPTVSSTWRSPALQDLLLRVGNATEVGGGRSCHNHLDGNGTRAARAVDVWNQGLDLSLVVGRPARLAAEVDFLRARGRHAKQAGLRWGGDWRGHATPLKNARQSHSRRVGSGGSVSSRCGDLRSSASPPPRPPAMSLVGP